MIRMNSIKSNLARTTEISNNKRFFQIGARENPHALPDAKRDPKALECFPDAIQNLMTDEVKTAVSAIPTIRDSLVFGPRGGYALSEEKLRQKAYDQFHQNLTKKYGQDSNFFGLPKELTPQLKSRLIFGREYLFGCVLDGNEILKMLVLPRDELIKLEDGQYYQSRHTHAEFLRIGDEIVLAAGTFIPTQYELKFNFRTGHFNVHFDDPKKLHQLRVQLQEIFQYANDKTLTNKILKRCQLEKFALEYKKEYGAKHLVSDEC